MGGRSACHSALNATMCKQHCLARHKARAMRTVFLMSRALPPTRHLTSLNATGWRVCCVMHTAAPSSQASSSVGRNVTAAFRAARRAGCAGPAELVVRGSLRSRPCTNRLHCGSTVVHGFMEPLRCTARTSCACPSHRESDATPAPPRRHNTTATACLGMRAQAPKGA